MLRAAEQNGICRIIATPHVIPGVKAFDMALFLKRLERIRSYCEQWQLSVEVFPGSEILYTEQTCDFLNRDRIPTMAGTSYVLVEFSPDIGYRQMQSNLERLSRDGYIPILAHMERYHCLINRPQSAYELKERLNVRYQVNCSTIIDGKGFAVNRFSRKLLHDKLIDAVATDAHNIDSRPVHMMEAYLVLKDKVDEGYADWLTGVGGGLVFS